MKETNINSLGFELKAQVPDSVEEYDNLAKKQGACLESAVNNVLYRSVLADFRAQFCEAVENNTGIKRATEPTGRKSKNEDGTEEDILRFTETEAVYFKRVCAELVSNGTHTSVEAAAASFASLAQGIISNIVFDPSERERQPSQPKSVAKKYLNIAQEWVDAGQTERRVEQMRAKLGDTWKVEGTVESLARAIAEDQRRKAAAVKSEYDV
mgnify:CR=1 FL=1